MHIFFAPTAKTVVRELHPSMTFENLTFCMHKTIKRIIYSLRYFTVFRLSGYLIFNYQLLMKVAVDGTKLNKH